MGFLIVICARKEEDHPKDLQLDVIMRVCGLVVRILQPRYDVSCDQICVVKVCCGS
jgi:hypothetical protein